MYFLKHAIRIFFLITTLAWCQRASSAADYYDKWQIHIIDSLSYNDNLFLLSRNSQTNNQPLVTASNNDTINVASLVGLVNFKFSKQEIHLKSQVDNNQFLKNSQLNHFSTDNLVLYRWRVGKYFSGDLGYDYRIYQGGFSNTNFFGKDLITDQAYYARGGWSWNPKLRLFAGANWLNSKHSATARNFLDRQTTAFSAGIEYHNLKDNIGLLYTYSESALPNQQLNNTTIVDNYSTQKKISFIFKWQFLSKTQLDGDFGYTKNEFRKFSSRNFSGLIGKLSLTWEATEKSKITINAWRQLITAPDITATYIVGKGISVVPNWSITKKINLTGSISWENRDYSGDPGIISGNFLRNDEFFTGLIAIKYAPIENADLELLFTTGKRTSNLIGADYDFSKILARAVIKF